MRSACMCEQEYMHLCNLRVYILELVRVHNGLVGGLLDKSQVCVCVCSHLAFSAISGVSEVTGNVNN